MKLITLLPADRYVLINKTILTEIDKKNLINLYEPIIGFCAVSLYLTFFSDLDRLELMSKDFTHHHLMNILKCDLETIKQAREALEAVGLLKTYVKVGDVNSYVYELYSPLTAQEFYNNPILNIVLYNNIGEAEYNSLKNIYQDVNIDLTDYEEITKTLNETFEATNIPLVEAKKRNTLPLNITSDIDFDFLISSIPKTMLNPKAFTKKIRELIINLSFIYNLDNLQMLELIRTSLTSSGHIDSDELRKKARKNYQFNNDAMPTLVYRETPEYLKTSSQAVSKKDKIIAVFENTSPYDFLKDKYGGNKPTPRDLKLLESLLIDLELPPAVVNVLIDYVLRKNNNRLSQSYLETIAGQWKRQNLKTAKEAMEFAEQEHKKMQAKGSKTKPKSLKENAVPIWFNENIAKEQTSEEEQKELENLLKNI